ncbi:hypothetical protein DITRI_Ditri13aG0056400 [Diplodiscus trichospermus]
MSIPLEIGFRFLPPDEQIISFFLLNKMNGHDDRTRRIREVDLLKQEPWDLPALSIVQSQYPEWLFFYKLNKISEGKNDRATQTGYWKSTGQDRLISCGGRVIGTKKTLVFYKGRTPRGVKTDWVMHEYRATAGLIPPKAENSYVVGFLRNKAAENPENSISYDGQPSRQFGASTSQNNAAGVTSWEVAPQSQSCSMDFEIAFQTQMEDDGIFEYDLQPLNSLLNLPPSSAGTSYDQNNMEEEIFTWEDLPPSNDLVDDEQNDLLVHFGTIEQEKDFMTCMFPNQEEYPHRPDFWTPDYVGRDHVLTSNGTGPRHSERFSLQRMENGYHHDEILIMHPSVPVTENEIKMVREEKSVNSRTCKSQYEPGSHLSAPKSQYGPRCHVSVKQGQPKRVQLQGKSSGEVVSRDTVS